MENNYSPLSYRRSYERFLMSIWAEISVIKENLEKRVIIKDLSARGAGVVCSYPLSLNEKVVIMIKALFSDEPVNREAKVIWCKKIKENLWQAGLDFGLDNKIELKGLFSNMRRSDF